jgi:thiosulfate/3-mercaptopyruvate sulfurtransferase
MTSVLIALFLANLSVPHRQTLVTTQWLANHFDDQNVIVLQVFDHHPPAGFTHIPGAHVIAIDDILIDKNGVKDELPSVAKLTQVFENAAIGDVSEIVLVSDYPLAATRTFFTLDYLGHGDRVSILDGGLTKWKNELRPTSTAPIRFEAAMFTPKVDHSRLVTMKEMQQYVTGSLENVVLLDARPASHYRGVSRGAGVLRRGHIPGANCLPWSSNLQLGRTDSTYRTWSQLDEMYTSMNVKPGVKTIVYCRTGVEASMPYFILRSLGYDVALYDGSMNEWTHESTNAVARLTK